MIKKNGFTLVEILMVVVIVGILLAVGIPQFIDLSDEAKQVKTTEKLNEIKIAIMGDSRLVSNGNYLKPGFENQLGVSPASLNDLVSQGAWPNYDPFTKRGWRGPYLDSSNINWNRDSWGELLNYNQAARTLSSCGSNKICGDADDITIQF